MNERVAMLMSGGVDSSVSASLLKKEGYDVFGVFIKILNPTHISCNSNSDMRDSMRACANLNIPFIVLDATEEYRRNVIEPFVDEYRNGYTPNPDILCNKFIKFSFIYKAILNKGFNTIATGHYAINKDGVLFSSLDKLKDQTYFIHQIEKDVLKNTMFPIGKYTKDRVRSLAVDFDLPAAHKKDSTGLCFLGDVSMKDFLMEYIEPKKGDVIFGDRIIGEHDGVWFYTEGQRQGFRKNSQEIFFIIGKDIEKNILYVSNDTNFGCKMFSIHDVYFRVNPRKKLFARYRHRGELFPINFSNNEITFDENKLIAKGQSIVIYGDDGECFGGGVYK